MEAQKEQLSVKSNLKNISSVIEQNFWQFRHCWIIFYLNIVMLQQFLPVKNIERKVLFDSSKKVINDGAVKILPSNQKLIKRRKSKSIPEVHSKTFLNEAKIKIVNNSLLESFREL